VRISAENTAVRIAIGFASWFQRIGMCDGRWGAPSLAAMLCAQKVSHGDRVRIVVHVLHLGCCTRALLLWSRCGMCKAVSGFMWIMRARWGWHATVRVLAFALGPLGLVQAAENGEHAHTKAARDNLQHPDQPELRNRTRPECVTRRPRPLVPTACTQACVSPVRQHRHSRHRDARAQVYVAGLNEDAFAIGTTGVVIPAPLDGGSNVWIAKWCVRTAAALWCPRARQAYGGLLAHKRRAVGGELSLGAPLPHLHHDSPAPHLPPDPALIASRRRSDFGSRAVRSGGSTGTGPTASSRTTRGSRPSRASSTGQSPAGTKRKSVRAHACAPIDTRIFGVCANRLTVGMCRRMTRGYGSTCGVGQRSTSSQRSHLTSSGKRRSLLGTSRAPGTLHPPSASVVLRPLALLCAAAAPRGTSSRAGARCARAWQDRAGFLPTRRACHRQRMHRRLTLPARLRRSVPISVQFAPGRRRLGQTYEGS
jgi:hypothetical protein